MNDLKKFMCGLPKAELHVHLEGTMEPEHYLIFAQRNNIQNAAQNLQQVQQLYAFNDLPSFIALYAKIMEVLCKQQDFYDVTMAYLKKVVQQGVVHAEIFFDVQKYVRRGVNPKIIIDGIYQAIIDAQQAMGISGEMILCFIREFGPEDALKTLQLLTPFKQKIIGIGLASLETGYDPHDFKEVFKQARLQGYHTVAHQGECSSNYLVDVITALGIERLDHGIYAWQDPQALKLIQEKNITLTVCPLSNFALGIEKKLNPYPLKKMINAGLSITINSDDPALFKGYILDNYLKSYELGLSTEDLVACARNSINASFIANEKKQEFLQKMEDYLQKQCPHLIRN